MSHEGLKYLRQVVFGLQESRRPIFSELNLMTVWFCAKTEDVIDVAKQASHIFLKNWRN